MEMKVARVSGNGQQALMTDGGVAHMRALDSTSTWISSQILMLKQSKLAVGQNKVMPIELEAWRPTSVRWGPTPHYCCFGQDESLER
ncbi:hypothetical protein OPV22_001485 [Ensete ventricosum]|uniref:Uncharacterized protein n=1 Tax=Ensete ventricosum TaxID=4639 RepID=A0AAV8QIN4_ENSVE|nr:hypothetical protein OPV22_001485 [Ensete ventricosum]